jgi:hypothetical protein
VTLTEHFDDPARRLPLGSRLYFTNEPGWIKLKNPNYWRRDSEREAMARKHERRARGRV